MNKIIAITWKDALLRFSSKAEWLFFLILPIVFTVVLAGGAGPQGDNRIRLVVVDQAGSPLAQELVAALELSNTVRTDLLTLTEAEAELSQRRTSAVLIIPAGFSLDGRTGTAPAAQQHQCHGGRARRAGRDRPHQQRG
jgi:ABC-2 type transport system permease protein